MSPRHVAVVAGGVDQQQFAGLHLPLAVRVVQDRRVRSAADNRRIAPRDGAAAAVHGLDRRLHLVFVRAGARGAHAGHLRLARNLEALRRAPAARTASSPCADRSRIGVGVGDVGSRRSARASARRTPAAGVSAAVNADAVPSASATRARPAASASKNRAASHRRRSPPNRPPAQHRRRRTRSNWLARQHGVDAGLRSSPRSGVSSVPVQCSAPGCGP